MKEEGRWKRDDRGQMTEDRGQKAGRWMRDEGRGRGYGLMVGKYCQQGLIF
jgi:hypothetical protein